MHTMLKVNNLQLLNSGVIVSVYSNILYMMLKCAHYSNHNNSICIELL